MTTPCKAPGVTTSVVPPGDKRSCRRRRSIVLLLENPRKSTNLGPILRCATAFGVTTIVAIGYAQCSVEGSHGASKHVRIVNFPTSKQAMTYLLGEEWHCRHVVGLLPQHQCCPSISDPVPIQIITTVATEEEVAEKKDGKKVVQLCATNTAPTTTKTTTTATEKAETAAAEEPTTTSSTATTITILHELLPHYKHSKQDEQNFQSFPLSFYSSPLQERFSSSNDEDDDGAICLAISTRDSSTGLSYDLAQHCHVFVHIPHSTVSSTTTETPPPPSTFLLDAPSCLSIALHHLTRWAGGYEEHVHEGHKFQVVAVKNYGDKQQQQQQQHDEGNNHHDYQQQQRVQEQRAKEKRQLLEAMTGDGAVANLFETIVTDNDGDY